MVLCQECCASLDKGLHLSAGGVIVNGTSYHNHNQHDNSNDNGVGSDEPRLPWQWQHQLGMRLGN